MKQKEKKNQQKLYQKIGKKTEEKLVNTKIYKHCIN